MMRQIPLLLDHRVSFGEQDFLVSPGNRPAFKAVRQWPNALGKAFALFGPAASGKTHLAEIWRGMTKAVRFDPAILTVDDPPHLLTAPALLADPLAFPLAENALLHLLNAVREQGCGLLLVAREPPVRWPIRLPDLRSRLAALPAIGLTAPDDALLAAVIVKLFADRQVRISPDVPEYLLRRIDRSFSVVSATVARLDQEALAQSRPVTLALAREVLTGSATPSVTDDGRPA